jgi:hypothetical protein
MRLDIDNLLDKYWEGETSIEDEKVLKQYFTSSIIEPEHEAFKDLFVFWDDTSKIEYPSNNQILDKQTIDIKPELNSKVRSLSIKKYFYAAAAVIVMTIASIFVVKNLNNEVQPKETYSQVQEIEDPEEALRVTKEALALLSKKLNSSTKTVKENMGELEKASIFK